MSFVGKVLIVAQLILSFCFMAFAAAVYTGQINWKAKADTLQQNLTKSQSDMAAQKTDYDTQLNQMRNERDQAVTRAGTAETDLAMAQQRLTQLESDMQAVDTLKGELAALVSLSQDEALARLEEVLRAREVNRELNLSQIDLLKNNRGLEDTVFAQEKQMQEMVRKHNEALEDIATYKLIMQQNKINVDPKEYARAQAPPPVVRGYVVETRDADSRGTEKLVEISIGQRDGLVEGHTLYIYRPGERNAGRGMYLGKIRLLSVTPNRAVGIVIERAKTGIIEQEDHVTTQL